MTDIETPPICPICGGLDFRRSGNTLVCRFCGAVHLLDECIDCMATVVDRVIRAMEDGGQDDEREE